MLSERPNVERAVQAVFAREGFTVRRMPEDHAGGKWALRYESAFGRTGNLEVDLNFMFRIPLWPVTVRDSKNVGAWQATGIPVLDYHELAAGKFTALLSRKQARDLFDSDQILRMENLENDLLRIGFVVYGAMNRVDWRTVSVENLDFDATELSRQLIPTLRARMPEVESKPTEYGARLVEECRERLSAVLPFLDNERAFLDLLLDRGIIDSRILTPDPVLQQLIQRQPLLEWKALNVRRYKGLA